VWGAPADPGAPVGGPAAGGWGGLAPVRHAGGVSDGPTRLPELPAEVAIRDVGPRDGLQPERPVAVEDRLRLIEALVAAGVSRIEAVAFVSPKAVPAMAGAAEVMAAVPRSDAVRYAALVPNVRGAELALAAGVDELTVTISISEAYNQRNVKMSTAESEAVIGEICALAGVTPVDAVLSCAFGSPTRATSTPPTSPPWPVACATPAAPRSRSPTPPAWPPRPASRTSWPPPAATSACTCTRPRGTAMVNAYAAMALGVARFDTSVGGLGGSPFAHGAAGNLATEELVAVLDDLGVRTGIDVEALVEAAALAAELVGHPVPSRVAAAGPRHRLARTEG
jgi:hydroxymethylglutaryl-CoA lyase